MLETDLRVMVVTVVAARAQPHQNLVQLVAVAFRALSALGRRHAVDAGLGHSFLCRDGSIACPLVAFQQLSLPLTLRTTHDQRENRQVCRLSQQHRTSIGTHLVPRTADA